MTLYTPNQQYKNIRVQIIELLDINTLYWIISIAKYTEDITRGREDMKFIFSWKKYFTSERSERVKFFFPREDELHIFKLTFNFLFIT